MLRRQTPMLLHGEGADDVPLGVQLSRASAAHAALQASPPALSESATQACMPREALSG